MSREVMQQALDALLKNGYHDEAELVVALRAELAKPEPEPFAYVTKTGLELARQHEDDVPLYCKEGV